MRVEDMANEEFRRIVLAEDDVEMRRLVARQLRRDAYDVVECPDGNTLFHLIHSYMTSGDPVGVDLIISDIRMPGLTGFQVLELLRAKDPFTPVIVMTAFVDLDSRLEAARLGVAAFFEKPFDLDRLRRVVRLIVSPEWKGRHASPSA